MILIPLKYCGQQRGTARNDTDDVHSLFKKEFIKIVQCERLNSHLSSSMEFTI